MKLSSLVGSIIGLLGLALELRPRTERRRAVAVDVSVHALNRMLGRVKC